MYRLVSNPSVGPVYSSRSSSIWQFSTVLPSPLMRTDAMLLFRKYESTTSVLPGFLLA
jgi:hypothetical protein